MRSDSPFPRNAGRTYAVDQDRPEVASPVASPRFTITVRRAGVPLMTYSCDNHQEASALRDAFNIAYYPHVAVTVVDREATAREWQHMPE